MAVEAEPEAANGCRFAAQRDADIHFLLWLVARAGRVLARRAWHVAGLIVRRFRLRRRRSLASHRPWGGVYKDASGWLSFHTTTTTTASTRRFLLFDAFPRVACWPIAMSYYPHHDPTQPPQLTMPTTPSALSGSNHSTPLNFNSWDMSDPSTGHSELSNAFSNQDYGSPTQAIQFFQDSASSPTTSSHAQSPAIITLDERPAFLPHERRALARREQAEAQRPARSLPGESRGQSMTAFAGQETLLPLNSPVGASDAKGKAGPARMSPTHIHSERDRAHPYNRPQHAGGSSAIAHSMSASGRSESARRTSDQTHVRFSSGIQATSSPGSASGGAGTSHYGAPGGSGDADVGMSGMRYAVLIAHPYRSSRSMSLFSDRWF